ncbi:MAG TPA: hypothetical protein VHW95_18560 [Steroidobacteraceae bacterium]|jgi:hypothetical protein|nr:hypothetical protein [Steroidobacteraceae bacterium]
MNHLQESVTCSPQLFPYSMDLGGDSISFVTLAKADYEKASFLDARMLTPQTRARSLPWGEIVRAIESAQLKERLGFIFHIGHVGSTLLSRLIGAHPCAFSLREPMLLRGFAQLKNEPRHLPAAWGSDGFEARLTGTLQLFSRTFEDRELAVVKATSVVSELSAALLSRASAPKAIMMYVSPESYIATILGGPNSRQEARMLTPGRLQRLQRRIGCEAWRAEQLSEGETLALAWACEMSALAQAARSSAARLLRVDFDQFLLNPSSLVEILRHFDIEAAAAEVHAILQGPDMRRYSKAPEYAYDAALRLEVLNQARALHDAEIRRGLNWLGQAAARFEPVRQAVMLAPSL